MNSTERSSFIDLRLALSNYVLLCATCRGEGRVDGKTCPACGRARAALDASDQLLRAAPEPHPAPAEDAPILSSALRRQRALAARERYP